MKNDNFTSFAILTTKRLTLRQLLVDDQNDILSLRSDKDINKYLNRPPSNTIEHAINFIYQINENINLNHSHYWAITPTATQTFVGTICLFNFAHAESSCEIGYELMKKFQGQGIMKEAAQAVIDYVFQTLKIKQIVAFTHSDNQNSTKLLQSLNFKKSATTSQENTNLDYFIFTA